MSEENVEIGASRTSALNAGDVDGFSSPCDRGLRVSRPARALQGSGVFIGHDAMRGWYGLKPVDGSRTCV